MNAKETELRPPKRPLFNKGFHEEWVGSWGRLNDGRSKIARRKKSHLNDLETEYGPFRTRGNRRRAEKIATLRALADKMEDTMGEDPKATVRNFAVLTKLASYEEARLLASVMRNGSTQDLASIFSGQSHAN